MLTSSMSFKTFCDICDKEIKKEQFHVRGPHLSMEYYCESCWINKKNWAKIHKVDKETDE